MPTRTARRTNVRLALNRFLPYLLVNLSKRLSSALSSTYQRHYNLSIPEWRVLANLNQAGAMTSRDIALQTYMDKVKVSRAIKRLEHKRWVERSAHPGDSRAQVVALTEAGRAVIGVVVPIVLDWEADLLSALTRNERRVLMTVIDKLYARLDQIEAGGR